MTLQSAFPSASSLARCAGPNPTAWHGLTVYRANEVNGTEISSVDSLSVCWILQGKKRVSIGPRAWTYQAGQYLVVNQKTDFRGEVLEAEPTRPFISLVLRVDPPLVHEVLTQMSERSQHDVTDQPVDVDRPAFVAPFDTKATGALARFLTSLGNEDDRRVLAPMYLREIVYRILQADQSDRLRQAATLDNVCDTMALAARYVRQNLAHSLTVGEIAAQVGMSESALARMFKELAGTSPYQFIKESRLERACALLSADSVPVGEVARAVGYTSPSHFSNDFHRRYGVTPRSYVRAQQPMPYLAEEHVN